MTTAFAVSPVAASVAVAVMLEEKVEGRTMGAPVKLPSVATVTSTGSEVQPERLSDRLTLTVSPVAKPAPERPATSPGAKLGWSVHREGAPVPLAPDANDGAAMHGG